MRSSNRLPNHDVQLHRLNGSLQVNLLYHLEAVFGVYLWVDTVTAFKVTVAAFFVGLFSQITQSVVFGRLE